MKLQSKLALYNTISKVIIIVILGTFLPSIVSKVAILHIDHKLTAKKDKVMRIVMKGDLDVITEDEACSFGNYNLLKEEFITITPTQKEEGEESIGNSRKLVDNELVDYRLFSYTFVYDNQPYLLEMGEGLSSIYELIATLKTFTFWVMIIMIAITLITDFGFTQYLLRPFNKIIQTKLVTAFHPDEFNFTPVPTTTDEFKRLDDSIIEMMSKVKVSFHLEKEFIANVSHELLTPISILQNRFENIIAEEKVSDDVAEKIIESQRTLNRMTKIIRALLLISKIENHQYLKKDRVNFGQLFKEITEELQERFSEKNLNVKNNLSGQFYYSECNRELLFIMFSNIFVNAIKYGKNDGEIIIDEKIQTDNEMLISISDNGLGIQKDHLPHLFNRFKRFQKHDNAGFGLGLPIVKTIADFHKINIEVNSEPGKGSSFSFQIKPVSKSQ